jgi:hypothetical protein
MLMMAPTTLVIMRAADLDERPARDAMILSAPTLSLRLPPTVDSVARRS